MEQKRVLILAEHNDEIKKELKRRFSARCELMFAEDLQNLDATLSRAEMIIGEPEQEQLVKAKALSLLQLTWAGADKYAGMPDFPEQTTLCNVSGAFGTIISEYVLGSIVALYRADRFTGELNSSEEGRVFWIEREEFAKLNTIWGMKDVLRVCDEAEYSEMFYSEEKEGWVLLG